MSCQHTKKELPIVKIRKRKTESVTGDTTKILMSRTYLHVFSDPMKPDTFKISLIGSSINKAKFLFEIVSVNNGKVYSEKDDASDLLGDLDDMTVKQNEDTIRVRFDNFLSADVFFKPALDKPKATAIDTDYVDLKTQIDISSDSTAVGFSYNMGYESNFEIAYSKSQKKTVICFASD
ncbi:hypothetical protein JN11_00286 [Mucilaginibacter frigoritolerans]|uniref:Uncharacterized protein n=2 Tax=Mucilaginibacter frigoritolerans TaxID=652788 RepID=A0A562UFK0_9SPHI|nr:hypothetical protein JN11_00286 [Mucilaginibacter frigoritolerans]